jgi:hypothetical protein
MVTWFEQYLKERFFKSHANTLNFFREQRMNISMSMRQCVNLSDERRKDALANRDGHTSSDGNEIPDSQMLTD